MSKFYLIRRLSFLFAIYLQIFRTSSARHAQSVVSMVKLVGVIGGGEDKDKGSEGGEGMGRVACLARRQFPLVRKPYD